MNSRRVAVACIVILSAFVGGEALAQRVRREAGEAQWIWAARDGGQRATLATPGVCYFRKTLNLKNPVEGSVAIACQDRYELFVNGRPLASGDDWRILDSIDIGKYLVGGRNVIAVRAESGGDVAGLVARVTVRSAGGTYVSYSTDGTWRASTTEHRQWNWPSFSDGQWSAAVSLGEFGRTQPWGDKVRPVDGSHAGRFKLPAGFHVERVVAPDDCGSLTTLTFDEFGNILAAREGGPILRISDSDRDGVPDKVSVLTETVKACQGLLAVNGSILATGDGPEGPGLYRLDPPAAAGDEMPAKLLIKFTGGMSEHGPHIPALGPDGLIYIVVGNFAAPDAEIAKDSPHRHFYEGDLVQPKYEDAGGHAVGFKAPGGVILRTDLEGSFVERFAGGLRNAYGIAFNKDGELFTYDSDMEWDEGLPWYRPTRVLHIVPGAEFGWRSGWSIWPSYFLDSLPPILETGRGSPTGIEVYEHYAFPAQYHGAMFACDWTNGRILAITLRPAHGTYQAASETFIEGKPLNVTDAKVGPEGALYFCTGGRGTEGGVYRVVYEGTAAAPRLTGIQRALQQPQFFSAYSREAIAAVQEQLGDDWGTELARVALDARSPTGLRLRALDLMHLYGPFPTTELLVEASKDAQPMVRARSATLMGLHADESTHARLVELLDDAHPTVRRCALEAFVRAKQEAPIERTIALLGDPDRYVVWAARMALLNRPAEQWSDKVIAAESLRVFNHGAAALLAVVDDRETALKVLARAEQLLQGYLSDDDFVDLLRVMQIAMHRGNISGDDVPKLRALLAEEYPANAPDAASPGHRINRELLRLLAHMQESSVLPRLIEQATGRGPLEERLHAAIHARFITAGWTQKQKETMLGFFEQARGIEGGYSLSRYIENVARDFVANFTDDERAAVLVHAQHWPAAALGVLMKLPENPGPEMLAHLQEIDQQLAGNEKEAAQRLRIGIAAVLARSKDEQAMAYLRGCFETEPERRAILAMGLAQSPGGENWPLLIRALPVLDGPSAVEVLQNLLRVEVVPDKADSVRQVILCGLRLGNDGGEHAIKLLEFWFDEQLGQPDDSVAAKLKAWQAWYVREFPEEPPPTLPIESAQTRYTLGDLEKFLSDKQTQGDSGRGEIVFTKAQCVKCHRFGPRGEVVGPDLTTVSRRFQKKEVLESVLFPSHVISDQYASKNILTRDGRQLTGIVGRAAPGQLVVLTSTAQKLMLRENDVEQMEPSSVSAMPEGLFNNLTLEEIADLFAYLYSPSTGSRRTARRAEPARRE